MPDSASEFWTFSLQTYAKPNVASICLELQDRFGVDVNLLLYMLWAASRGRRLHVREIADIAGYVQSWQQHVVTPLRIARRHLKSPPAGWSFAETDQLRQRVKAEELEAERLQQNAMANFLSVDKAGEADMVETAAKSNLMGYASLLALTFPECHVSVLTQAIAKT